MDKKALCMYREKYPSRKMHSYSFFATVRIDTVCLVRK